MERRRKIEEVDVVPEEVFAPATRRLAIAATVRRVTEAARVDQLYRQHRLPVWLRRRIAGPGRSVQWAA